MNSKYTLLLPIAVVALAAGLIGGYWFASLESGVSNVQTDETKPEPLFYRNPMNPEVTSPVPAKDNMGMDYIPVFADDDDTGPDGTVSIDPVTVQNIGVRTAVAEAGTISREIHTLGRVDYDEQRITRLHPKTQGWIEELRIGTTGEAIDNDEILLSIYSPQLVSSQREFLLALNNLETLVMGCKNQSPSRNRTFLKKWGELRNNARSRSWAAF